MEVLSFYPRETWRGKRRIWLFLINSPTQTLHDLLGDGLLSAAPRHPVWGGRTAAGWKVQFTDKLCGAMIYVWKLDKLIFFAWLSNICIKPWIGLQMFINSVCHNSVKSAACPAQTKFEGGESETKLTPKPSQIQKSQEKCLPCVLKTKLSEKGCTDNAQTLPNFHKLIFIARNLWIMRRT